MSIWANDRQKAGTLLQRRILMKYLRIISKKRKHLSSGLRNVGLVLFGGGVFHGVENGELLAAAILCGAGLVCCIMGCEE